MDLGLERPLKRPVAFADEDSVESIISGKGVLSHIDLRLTSVNMESFIVLDGGAA